MKNIKCRAFTKLGMIEDVSITCPDDELNKYHWFIHLERFEEQVEIDIWKTAFSINEEILELYDLSSGDDSIYGISEIMLCTGLISRHSFVIENHNKDLYYGDIIRFSNTEGIVYEKEVWWSEEYQCTMIGNMPYFKLHESAFIQPSKLEFEIIGNIHENPEWLIENKK